jgi:hypothetical protein
MVDRIVAVVALAGALLIALAVSGTFSSPPSPALGAAQYQYCQYGMDQYGNCLPPPTDTTPPRLAVVESPAPNTFGWNNVNATLTLTASDEAGGSGVASITCQVGGLPPTTTPGAVRVLTFIGPTMNAVVTCTAADNAGNVSTPVARTIRIDKIPPAIAFAMQTPLANGFGWNDTPVTLQWNCSDTFSGVVAPISFRSLPIEGFGQSATGTCTDRAGNSVSDTRGGVNIDLTRPTITFLGQTPPANANGWNKTPVELDWTCTDTLSGVAPALSMTTLFISTEGANQQATGTCADYAGNFSSDPRGGVNVDQTPPNTPLATVDRVPDFAGGGGWYRDSVTVSFAANGDPDGANGTAGSGVDPTSIPQPMTFTTDGAHVASGTISDLAGNVSAPASLTVQVDATPPAVSATFANADGTPYVPGTWTNQSVTATFACDDGAGSGVASTSGPVTVSGQGSDQTVTGTCTDNVGHTATETFSGIDIDMTPPEATVAFDPTSGDVVVVFTDTGGSGVPGGPVAPTPAAGKGNRAYSATDGAGNSLAIVLNVVAKQHDVDAVFQTLSYDGGPAVDAPQNDFDSSFGTNKDGSIKRLRQDVRIGTGSSFVEVSTDFDPKSDETTIQVGGKSGGTTTLPGVVLIEVSTNAGSLVVGH